MYQSHETQDQEGQPAPHSVDLTFRITHPTIAGLDQLTAALRDAHTQAQATVPGGRIETLYGAAHVTPQPADVPAPDVPRGRLEALVVGAFTALSFASFAGVALGTAGFAVYQLVRLIGALT